MKSKKKVELLAPAGNKEAFYGAIHAGADAVYLGGSRFGARAYADNFTEEELVSCIRYAHIFGKKVYLTVNTLVKESELAALYDYLLPYYKAGLDGVIVQDIGVFSYIRNHFPDMELHVSTQMTITGKYGANLLKEMGACRVVPARELSLAEMIALKKETGLEIEAFIHGAMCYCYSGQCLFSSILGGRSGNRGRCAQPCRLPYRVKDKANISKECFPLSLKDMCTIEHIPQLIEAGIDSFKIEGRMKKPEYAAGVTAIYRKYIDLYEQAPGKPFRVSKEDMDILSSLYIRSERQDGYYFKPNGRDMVTLDSPAYSGSNDSLLAEIRTKYLEHTPKFPLVMYGSFVVGEPATLTIVNGANAVTVTGDMVQAASKQPITKENIEKQLKKLGNSIFQAKEMILTVSEQAFYSLKAINELRRMAVARLEDEMILQNKLPVSREEARKESTVQKLSCTSVKHTAGEKTAGGMVVSVRTLEQLNALLDFPSKENISKIYLDADLFMSHVGKMQRLLKPFAQCEIILALPYILRAKEEAYMSKLLELAEEYSDVLQGFLVKSLEAMGFLLKHHYSGNLYTDAGFYIWNQETVKVWESKITGLCLPFELKAGEQMKLLESKVPCEKIVYGRIPMMITANCIAKTTDACRKGTQYTEPMQLIDRYQKCFPVLLNCNHCMNIIYNSVPLSLHAEVGKWQERAKLRIDFTIESEQETKEILVFFDKLLQGNQVKELPFQEYTTGHEKRGVE